MEDGSSRCQRRITSGYVPMGALFISDRLIADIKAAGNEPKSFFSGFTYSGHPVAAAAALTNLDMFEHDELLEHVANVAPHFEKRLQELSSLPMVREVRVKGMMAGVECCLDPDKPDDERDIDFLLEVDDICQENGLLLRPVYSSAVLSPALTKTTEQIDALVQILRQGLETAWARRSTKPK